MNGDVEAPLRSWLAAVAASAEVPADAVEAAAKRACEALLGGGLTAPSPAGAKGPAPDPGVPVGTSPYALVALQLLEALVSPDLLPRGVGDGAAAIAALRSPDPWGEANRVSLDALRAGAAGQLPAWWQPVAPTAARVIGRLARHDPVAALGIWAHLVPAWRTDPDATPLVATAESFLLAQQHPDGLAYPAGGGGACPDFNWLSVVLACREREIIGHQQARRGVERLLGGLALGLDDVPARESFRLCPLPPWRRWRQPPSVRHWTSPGAYRGHQLARGDWFSTLMRVTTLLSALGWLYGESPDRSRSFHHLGCWIPARETSAA